MATDRRHMLMPRPALHFAVLVLLMALIFVADTLTELEIAVSVFYAAVILGAIDLLPKRGVVILACACVALTAVSFALTAAGATKAGLINAAISVAAIAITTYLALKIVTAEAAVHESRAQLARMARVTSLGELAASIAHEVNQPLAAVATSAHACQRWLALEPANLEKARLSIARIIGEAERAGAVIARVRGLIKGGAPQKEWLDLNWAASEAIALAHSEIERKAIALRASLASDLPPVLADKVQLQQVIANLILNAMEAMADGPGRELEVSSRAEAGTVVFAVADAGVGLSADALGHLFEAFWTTKPGGIGIGLAICRSIVEAHGGRIWATARPDGGTLFQFSLPA
jgi:C4-dicarboxylate-specific signal transduction histidine kinase